MRRQGMWVVTTVALLALAGCRQEAEAPAPAAAPAPVPQKAETAVPAVELRDVIETNDRYVLGISYPPAAAKYPGLARELVEYADAARTGLLHSVELLGNDKPSAPYELSLSFELLVDNPRVVAASANGSVYTGGAHGSPLVARFVWLPEREQLLGAEQLIPSAEGWQAVSQYVARQLHSAAAARLQAGEPESLADREALRSEGRMIDQGTAPEPENFAQFQPLLGADGRISAIRFVFPPYQVGPYSDGTQTVDVPASLLRPHVAPDYVELFSTQ